MNIRPATVADASVLTEISRRAKAHWPYSADQLDAWRSSLLVDEPFLGRSRTFVADVGGEAGAFYALLDSDDAWRLEHLWVLPRFMGQGIGKTLLHHARSLAERHGIATIVIDADPYAEAFYVACGAKRVGIVSAPIAGQPERYRPQLVLASHAP